MKKIYVNKKKLVLAVCIAISAASGAVLVPRAVKNAKHSKHACV